MAKATKKKDNSSPWCTDPQHPAEVGMYGDMGYVDLINNEGQVPENVIGLFRQGLTHIYGFNNFEALRNFRTATKLSPDCACVSGVSRCHLHQILIITLKIKLL